MANATSTQLQELYVAYFGRAADPTGLDYWTEKGITTSKFAADMYAQAEFKDAYGSLSTESQVNQIYQNLFDRDADATGLLYWTKEIDLGNLQLAEIANHLIWAAQNNSGSEDDKTALSNKTTAAVAYTAKVKETTSAILAYQAESTSPWTSGSNIEEAVSYLSGIDKDTPSTTAGIAASVATITGNGVPSLAKNYSLTSSIDDIDGTAGVNKFSAGLTSSGGNTLNSLDELDGKAGTDTLNASIATDVTPGSIKNIENINITFEAAKTFNATNVSGVTTFTDVGATAAGTISNIDSTSTKLVVSDNSVGATFTYDASAVTGTADSVDLTLNNVTGGNSKITTITGAVETLNLTSSTSANTIRLNTSATTLNISGSADLTLGVDSTALNTTNTIDASNATGAITFVHDHTTAAQAVTITGGSGNDTITLTGTNQVADTVSLGAGDDKVTFTHASDLTDTDVIDGGAGTDTLVGTDGELTSLTTANNISNIEVLEASEALTSLTLTTATIDSAIKSVTLAGGAATGVVTFGAGTNTLTLGAANTALLTVNDTGLATNDVLNIATSKTANSGGTQALTINGFETVNIDTNTATAKSVGALIINGDPDSAGVNTSATLDIDGAAAFTAAVITLGSSTAGTGTINASDMTGAFSQGSSAAVGVTTITGGSGNDTILGSALASTLTGGAGDDAITGGTESDTISGGAGNDTITLTNAASNLEKDTITGGAGNDTFTTSLANLDIVHVIDGGAGTDSISMSNITAVTDSLLENKTSIEVLTSGAAGLAATLDVYAQAMGITTVTFAGTANGGIADTVTIQDDVTNAITVNIDTAVGADLNTVDASTYTGDLTIKAAIDTAINADTSVTAVLTGGTGTNDTLQIAGDTYTAAQLVSITKIENWTILDDATTLITTNDANFDDGASIVIDGRAIINSSKHITANVILESNAALTVHGSTGGDTITATISDLGDTINTYAGADVINVGAAYLTTLDTIDGGAGTDTLGIITTAAVIADADFTNISNVEALNFVVASSNTDLGAKYVAAGFNTITIAGSLTNDLNLDSVTTAQTVNVGAGTDTIDASSMTAAMTVKMASNSLTNADTITAGTSTSDILQLTFDTAAAALDGVTGFETIKTGTDAEQTITVLDANVAAAKSLTVDASNMATKTATVDISAETNGAVTILGGNHVNTITLSVSSMGDTFTGGSGTDGVTVAVAQLTASDTLNGVSGTDTITLSDAGVLSDDDLSGVTNFDALTLANGTNTIVLGAQFEESGIATVTGGTGPDTITLGSGVTSAVTIALGTSAGDQTISATASSAPLTITVTEAGIDASDTITGGTGSDTLTVTFNNTTSDSLSAADMVGVTKIETIKAASNVAGVLALHDNNNVSSVVTVNAEINTTATFTLDASAEDDGTIVYSGGAGIDTVTGTATTATGDTISAGAGADVITGGGGADTITGGADADTFTYTALADSTGSTRDSVLDFTSGTDKFSFTINNSTNTSGQTYDATVQTARAGTSLVQSNLSGSIGQVIYDTTNSRLIVNSNADNLVTTLDYQVDVNAASTATATIAAGDINFSITAGSGIDTITTGDGTNTVVGNGGNDIITSGSGVDTFQIAYGGQGADSITGFAGGTDIIDFTGTTDVKDAAGTDLDTDGFLLLDANAATDIFDGLTIIDNSGSNSSDAAMAGSVLTAAEIATYLADVDGTESNGQKISVETSTDVAYVIVGSATNATLAKVTGGTDTTIDTADVTIIAHFTDVTDTGSLTAASFADFA